MKRFKPQAQQLSAAKSAAYQHGEHRVVSQLAGRGWCCALEKTTALLRGQPVPQSNSEPPHAFHTTDACGQFWTEEAGVGSLVRHAPNRGEPED